MKKVKFLFEEKEVLSYFKLAAIKGGGTRGAGAGGTSDPTAPGGDEATTGLGEADSGGTWDHSNNDNTGDSSSTGSN